MFRLKLLALSAAGAVLMSAASVAPATAQIGINIGVAPACPYGYYDYAPYNCSPYGYYGPDWFNSGVFIGAGPWFHGDRGFYGHVDNRFDVRHGYAGRCLDVAKSRSITSMATRLGMVLGMLVSPGTMRVGSIAAGSVGAVGRVAADVDNLCSS